MENTPISVFIPAYNSQNSIEDTVTETYRYLASHFADFELFIVDDTSQDQTVALVGGLMAERPRLRVITNADGPSRRENLGKAMYGHAGKELVFYFDSDLAVPLENVALFAREMKTSSCDICIATRYGGIKPNRTLYRLFLSRAFNFFLRSAFKSTVSDHICGFKAFKRESFRLVYQDVGYDKTLQRGWFWDAEMLIRAQRRSMAIKEVPVVWNAGKESTFNFWREIKLLSYIIKRRKALK